jgi:hypothetical protein
MTPDHATLRLLIAVCAVTLLCMVGMAMPQPHACAPSPGSTPSNMAAGCLAP